MRISLSGGPLRITFSASHLIPGHPHCGRLHGHEYAISAQIYGEAAEDGLVMDFLEVKRSLRAIAEELDHRTLLARGLPGLQVSGSTVSFRAGEKAYQLPAEDAVILEIPVCSCEHLAQHLLDRLVQTIAFPPNVERVEVGVEESPGQGAWASIELVHGRARRGRK